MRAAHPPDPPRENGSADVTVSRMADPDELWKIRDEWADLHDRSESVNPFLGPEWIVHWVRELLPRRDEAWVLVVRSADRLVGVAALQLHRHWSGIRRLQMIGTGPPPIGPFETPAVLAEPAYGRQVARSVAGYLAEHQHAWHIATVALGESSEWLEPGWLPTADFAVLCFKTTPYVILPLPMSPRGPRESRRNLREAVRRSRNRMNGRFGADGWRVERIVEPNDIAAAYRDLARLHGSRAANDKRGLRHTDSLSDTQVHDYLRTVILDLAERKQATIYRLTTAEDVFAAQLVLHTSTATFVSVSGFTDDSWDLSPTTFLQWTAATDAADRGHREFNLSAAPTQAKLRWSHSVRLCPEYLVVRRTFFGRFVAAPLFLVTATLSTLLRELRATTAAARARSARAHR